MENESNVKDILGNALDQVRTIMDADTIVGKQITTPQGVVIIPISKVAMGFASGGVDFPVKNTNVKGFGGGGGTGVTVAPIGFLIISPEGHVEMLPVIPEKSTPIEQVADIINSTPDLIERIKNIFFPSEAGAESAPVTEADELAAIEEEYRQKLAAHEATEEAEMVIEDTDALVESETAELSKEDKKRLKKEARELRKMEKAARKNAAKAGTVTVESADRIEAPDASKRGKISEKTLQKGKL